MKKYNFFTGEIAKKVRRTGYKYLGRGKIGIKIKYILVDGKRAYYLVDESGFRISPFTFDKSKFKKITYFVWEYEDPKKFHSEKEYIDIIDNPKDKLTFFTTIKEYRGFGYRGAVIPLAGNVIDEVIDIMNPSRSKIIRELQLKKGDEIKVTIEKVKGQSKEGDK